MVVSELMWSWRSSDCIDCELSSLASLSSLFLHLFVSGAVTGGVDLCTSRRLLVSFPETEGSFRGLSGPVLPQPVPPGLSLQPELLLGKTGPTPYFWECRSSGAPGFPLHGPLTGQYGPYGGWERGEPKDDGCNVWSVSFPLYFVVMKQLEIFLSGFSGALFLFHFLLLKIRKMKSFFHHCF